MSIPAINYVLDLPMSRSADKFLLLCLANHADEHGCAFPSHALLRLHTAQDRKTIVAGLKRLITDRFIEDTGQRKGATNSVVVYRVLGLSGPKSGTPSDVGSPENGTAQAVPNFPPSSPVFPSKRSQKRTEAVPKTGHRTVINHHGTTREPVRASRGPELTLLIEAAQAKAEPEPKRAAAIIEAEFATDFWPLVPKKVEKKDAMREYCNARTKRRVPKEAIINGMRRFAGQYAPLGPDPVRYSVSAAKWLRGDRWQDEAPAAGADASRASTKSAGNGGGLWGALKRAGIAPDIHPIIDHEDCSHE